MASKIRRSRADGKKTILVPGVRGSGGVSDISFFLCCYLYIDICVFQLHPLTLLLDHPPRCQPKNTADKKQINKCTWTLWRQQEVASSLLIKRNSLGISDTERFYQADSEETLQLLGSSETLKNGTEKAAKQILKALPSQWQRFVLTNKVQSVITTDSSVIKSGGVFTLSQGEGAAKVSKDMNQTLKAIGC